MAEEWIVVGEITAPQGVKGEVRVFPITDFPERLEKMRVCHLQKRNGTVESYTVTHARPHKGFYLVLLEGVTSRDAAETLRGAKVVIPRTEVAPLPEGRFYVFDLLGLSVYTDTGESVGVLQEVLSGPANDVYVVKRNGKPDALVPAVRQIVTSIDIANRKMVVSPIPGLFDTDTGDQPE